MASSSTGTLPDEVLWEELPEELLTRVLGHVMLEYGGFGLRKRWCSDVRGVSRQWRAVHDGVCESLHVRNGVTDEGMHMLCGRLPALTFLWLGGVKSLTEDGLRAVGGLTALIVIELPGCVNVSDVVLRELRDLPALTYLNLNDCTQVTDVGLRELRGLNKLTYLTLRLCNVTSAGLQHLTSLSALTKLNLDFTSTTQAGRDALKAALPALTIEFW